MRFSPEMNAMLDLYSWLKLVNQSNEWRKNAPLVEAAVDRWTCPLIKATSALTAHHKDGSSAEWTSVNMLQFTCPHVAQHAPSPPSQPMVSAVNRCGECPATSRAITHRCLFLATCMYTPYAHMSAILRPLWLLLICGTLQCLNAEWALM